MNIKDLRVGDIIEWEYENYQNFNLFHPEYEETKVTTTLGGIIKELWRDKYDKNKETCWRVIIYRTFPLPWTQYRDRIYHILNTGDAQTSCYPQQVLRKLDDCMKCEFCKFKR
jgi:hypothetical protein